MALGVYQNFPASIHLIETYISTLSTKLLQERLIQAVYEANRKEFSFEEAANPTIPDCTVIFEFGLADGEGFNFIDKQEVEKVQGFLEKEPFREIDFFCSIRYYKGKGEERRALKFDYYLLRTVYSRNRFEIQVHHERGPRYLSPEDLTVFIFNKINSGSKRITLKKVSS